MFYAVSPVLFAVPWIGIPCSCKFPASQTMGVLVTLHREIFISYNFRSFRESNPIAKIFYLRFEFDLLCFFALLYDCLCSNLL